LHSKIAQSVKSTVPRKKKKQCSSLKRVREEKNTHQSNAAEDENFKIRIMEEMRVASAESSLRAWPSLMQLMNDAYVSWF